MEQLTVTVKEAATTLSISTRKVRRLVDSGDIQGRRLGSRVVIDESSVRAYHASLPLAAKAK